MRELIDLAYDFPIVFDQMLFDMELVQALEEAKNGKPWRKPGESIGDARDRLKAQREKAKREMEQYRE